MNLISKVYLKAYFIAALALPTISIAEQQEIAIGAMGDSITSGFNAISSSDPRYRPGDHYDYSWSTGTGTEYGFKSHVMRLKELFPDAKFTVVNSATVSRESKDLPRQLDRLRAKAKSRDTLYDLVTIGIGGNDLCHIEDNFEKMYVDFERNLRVAVKEVIEGRDAKNGRLLKPRGKVLILEVPDAYNIWKMYFDFKTNVTLLPEKFNWVRTCGSKWNLGQIGAFRICKALFGDDASAYDDRSRDQETIARAEAFHERWKQINKIIHKVVGEFPNDIVYHPPRFPENQVKWDFSWEHVSPIDCFHPSIQGQAMISERAWNEEMFKDL